MRQTEIRMLNYNNATLCENRCWGISFIECGSAKRWSEVGNFMDGLFNDNGVCVCMHEVWSPSVCMYEVKVHVCVCMKLKSKCVHILSVKPKCVYVWSVKSVCLCIKGKAQVAKGKGYVKALMDIQGFLASLKMKVTDWGKKNKNSTRQEDKKNKRGNYLAASDPRASR